MIESQLMTATIEGDERINHYAGASLILGFAAMLLVD